MLLFTLMARQDKAGFIMTEDIRKVKIVTAKGESAEDKVLRETLAGNIIAYRKKAGLSRVELAKKVGVTVGAIGQYERSERTPQLSVVVSIANVLNVPIQNLLEQEPKVFDAVTEYRFSYAVEFLQRYGCETFENEDGTVSLARKVRGVPANKELADEDGHIYGYADLLIFNDKAELADFAENFISMILSNREINIMMLDYINVTRSGKDFFADFDIFYTPKTIQLINEKTGKKLETRQLGKVLSQSEVVKKTQ